MKIQQKNALNCKSGGEAAITNPYLSCQEKKILQNPCKSVVNPSAAKDKMPGNRISSHLESSSVLGSAVKNIHRQYYGLQNFSENFKNKGTQTDYRESECQTIPWEPPYEVIPGKKLTYQNYKGFSGRNTRYSGCFFIFI